MNSSEIVRAYRQYNNLMMQIQNTMVTVINNFDSYFKQTEYYVDRRQNE